MTQVLGYLPPHELQRINETMYARAHIDRYLDRAIRENPESEAKVQAGVTLLQDWLSQTYYPSKDARLEQIKDLDLESLVREIFIGIAYCQEPQLFTAVTAQLASRLHMSDKAEAITTIAEIVAVLCQTDAFDIIKAHASASLMVQSRLPLPAQLIEFIEHSEVLPPMVCEPRRLTHNRSSAHLTVSGDSLILGKGNHHEGDICLDVLNICNRVALRLDTTFLTTVEEEPTCELDTPEKLRMWEKFKKQSYRFYDLMVAQGNRFYLTHKVDKRGRIYAQGYHITSQGTSFKKASLELADAEYVTGVPNQK